jgi:cyd operon protein YbgT
MEKAVGIFAPFHSLFPKPDSRKPEVCTMWYFSWILGLGLALAFAILNAMWFELHSDELARREADDETPPH